MKQFYIYILTNQANTVLYTGMTNDLKRRIYEHKTKTIPGFTQKYNLTRLVYYEVFDTAHAAISREKQIKAGSRKKKLDLINAGNPNWKDLYEDIL
jgi:putative endonuclease